MVTTTVRAAADPVADDGKPGARGPVEQQIQELPLLGLVGHVGDQVGALEGEAEAEAVHGLIGLGEVDGYGWLCGLAGG